MLLINYICIRSNIIKKIRLIVTLNTDASFSNKYNVATYAFWIACDDGRFFRSGALKGSVFSPIHAEMKCIINALHYMFESGEFKSMNRIIINTDCLFAMQKLQNPEGEWGSSKKSELIDELRDIKMRYMKIFNDFLSKTPLVRKVSFEYRHVKAHTHTNNSRHFVNDFCDKEAKKQMGIVLKKFNKKNKNHVKTK